MRRRSSAERVALLLGLTLLTACSVEPDARSARVDRRNVLFCLVDTLRADHLTPYGYERPTSPAIDALAARSLVIERMYAQAPWTKPSVASLFTSLYSSQHRALTKSSENHLPDVLTTLPEVLQAAGYRTKAFSENPHVQQQTGFGQGFDQFTGTPGFHSATKQVLADTVAWLRAVDGSAPFFLYVHFLDPHGPYEPPPRYRAEFVGERETRNDLVRRGRVGDLIEGMDVPTSPLDADDVAYLAALYDGEIRSIDDAVGRLLTVLDEEGLTASTIVVLTSDHGEEFLEHGGLKHGFRIHDELLRVPLLVHVPGAAPARAGESMIQHIDVAPTLLELLDLAAPEQFQGRSFATLLSGGRLPTQPVIAECYWENLRLRAIRTEEWKLILDGRGEDMLFRIDEDPGETHDVLAQHADVAAELQALFEERTSHFTPLEDGAAQGAGDAELEQAMRDIGYADR